MVPVHRLLHVVPRETMPGKLTKAKAKKILKHGKVRGKKLTAKQRRFMGAKASGRKKR